MDNFRRGLLSHPGAGAETGLAVCLNEFKHQNKITTLGIFLGLVTKSYVVLF
jgi:hypothetical protein